MQGCKHWGIAMHQGRRDTNEIPKKTYMTKNNTPYIQKHPFGHVMHPTLSLTSPRTPWSMFSLLFKPKKESLLGCNGSVHVEYIVVDLALSFSLFLCAPPNIPNLAASNMCSHGLPLKCNMFAMSHQTRWKSTGAMKALNNNIDLFVVFEEAHSSSYHSGHAMLLL